MAKEILILGIDPGLANTGFGVINFDLQNKKIKAIDYGYIKTTAKEEYSSRLDHIYQNILELISKYKPEVMGVEELFVSKNVKTATKVGQAKGVILLAGRHKKVQVLEFTPLQIKMAVTGYGCASKFQVQKMVQQLLSLKTIPKPDHAADALATAICASSHLNVLHKKYD